MFYEYTPDGCILRIRVTPNAAKCAVGDITKDANGKDYLKISLITIPQKGKANQELIKFLSKLLNLKKSSITIISGQTDRHKKILLANPLSDDLHNILKTLGEQS